jgi:hypothetical protein
MVLSGEDEPFANNGPAPGRTHCDETSIVSFIDEAEARALGFGRILDRMALPIDVPFEWTPGMLVSGSPATGYMPLTRLQGTLRPTAFRHLVPTEESCQESLVVAVRATLQTGDGAFSIAGLLYSGKLQPESPVPSVGARLNLRAARGSLELFPGTGDQPLSGQVSTSFSLWPGGTRAEVRIDASPIGQTLTRISYDPLRGRGPSDACDINAWPQAFDDPSVTGSGASLAGLYPELRSWLLGGQPFAALWSGGAATSVRVALGDPVNVCESTNGFLSFRVPLDITSADGRVHIQQDASASLGIANDVWHRGWVEIYRPEPQDAATFVEATGIAGIDLDGIQSARWSAVQYFLGDRPPLSGEIGVDTIVRGELLELDRLSW